LNGVEAAIGETNKMLGLFMPVSKQGHRHSGNESLYLHMETMQTVASRDGYAVLVAPYSPDGHSAVGDRLIRDGVISGVIITRSEVDDGICERLHRMNIPFVLIHRIIRDRPYSCIGVDDRLAMREITEHLINKGYDNLMFLGGPINQSPQNDKRAGFFEALRIHGLNADEQRAVHLDGFVSEVKAFRMAKQILASEQRPRAIAASTDEIAFGVLRAAQALKLKVPEELAVTGFDDRERASHCKPPLTTVRVPWASMVSYATTSLIRLIDGQIRNVVMELNTQVIVRAST
jgi:LacI family transcriptional regulator